MEEKSVARQARIRNAVAQDLPAIDAMNRESLQENYEMHHYQKWFQNSPDLFFIAEIEVTKQDLEQIPEEVTSKLDVTQTNWMKVGYIFAQPSDHTRKNVHVYSFAVRTPYRKMKFGTLLMDHLHKYLLQKGETNTIDLNVRVDNHVAIAFYKKMGYKKTGRRSKYYSDGTDAFIMTHKFLNDLGEAEWKKIFARLSRV
jgi:ribosomal protein S18 acetylase RimI-like enzyme